MIKIKQALPALLAAVLIGTSEACFPADAQCAADTAGTAYIPVCVSETLRQEETDTVLGICNARRIEAGAKALVMDSALCRIAQAKADEMAELGYFSHTSPGFGSPPHMLLSFSVPYRFVGENIARGYGSAEEVMEKWMGSEGHRENILTPVFSKIGVGYNSSRNIWVQLFTD